VAATREPISPSHVALEHRRSMNSPKEYDQNRIKLPARDVNRMGAFKALTAVHRSGTAKRSPLDGAQLKRG